MNVFDNLASLFMVKLYRAFRPFLLLTGLAGGEQWRRCYAATHSILTKEEKRSLQRELQANK